MSVLNPNDWVGGDEPSLPVLLELLPTLVNEDPLVVATKLRSAYGRVVRVPPLHPALDTDVYLVSDPDAIRFVLQSDPSRFRALDVPGSRDFGRIVRNSIVSLNEEDEWTERLRLVAPEFAAAAAESPVPRLANTTLATLAELTAGPGQITSGDPARFDAAKHDALHEFAYYPFSGGRHACLGEAIASTEATVVLAATLATRRVEFAGTGGPHAAPDVGVDSAINLQPDREIPVRFVPRA